MKLLRSLFISFSSLLFIWWLGVLILQPPAYIFPGPLAVLQTISERYNLLLEHGLNTLVEILIGFIIANALSTTMAFIVAYFPKIENSAMSIAIALKTIPIIAIAPLLILWFGAGIWSKVAAVVLVCFFPALVNILRGIKSLDADLHDVFKLYDITKFQMIKYFILPGIRPYFFAALKVSNSLAIIGALVGEFISANKGIGFLIICSYYSMDVAMVFACILVVSAIGVIMYAIIELLEQKFVVGTETTM